VARNSLAENDNKKVSCDMMAGCENTKYLTRVSKTIAGYLVLPTACRPAHNFNDSALNIMQLIAGENVLLKK